MYKTYLSRGGNILLHDTKGRFSFHTPELEFIREVSQSEGDYILSNHPVEVEILRQDDLFDLCISGAESFPTWHFIKSVKVLDDYSCWKAETSNNGGDYSFHTYHDWYVGRYPDGKWKFAFVENYSTSAEFEYDELNGSFQTDLGVLHLSNVHGQYGKYQTQRGVEWVNGEKFYTSEEVLEKVGTIANFSDLWNEQYECIPSRWDEEGFTTTLSFSDKKEIITRLKELGVTKEKRPVRGQRRVRR